MYILDLLIIVPQLLDAVSFFFPHLKFYVCFSWLNLFSPSFFFFFYLFPQLLQFTVEPVEVLFFSCLVFLFDYNFPLCAEFTHLVLYVVYLFLLGLVTYGNHSSKNITCQILSPLVSEEFGPIDCFVSWKCIVFLLFCMPLILFFFLKSNIVRD